MTSEKTFQEASKTDFKLVEGEDEPARASAELNKPDFAAPAPKTPPVALETQAISLQFQPKTQAISLEFLEHPINFPDDTFWERRGRQIFNFFYLGLAIVSLLLIACTSEFLLWPALVVLVLMAILMIQAGLYAVYHKKMLGSSNVLAPRTQRNLRRAALYVPFMAFIVAASNLAGFALEARWHAQHHMYGALDGRALPSGALWHIETSSMIAPLNTILAARLYEEAKEGKFYAQQLAMADRMVFFKPFDERWKIRRLAALAYIPEKQDEFNKLSAEYKEKFADDGFLWNTLADIAQDRQDFPLALDMAREHARIHVTESLAYEQLSEIERHLGMNEDADRHAEFARNINSLK
ncbi:MAG: hypothetical protein JSS86_05105 [Cyanobacteria bacterium SZAS LIN-2]|nr:hypothetical protein [Cyanobacteria bacterium SZAS LIN-2]